MAHANNSGKVTRIYAKPRAVAKLADRTPWIVAGLFALLILSAIGAGYLGLVVLRWA